MSENSSKNNLQKFLIIISSLAFLGTMIIPMFSMFNQAPPSSPTTSPQSAKNNLQQVAQGYEKVLAQEPENPTALQGLAEVRLKMGDLPGAIAPMEKLVKLYPEEKQLKQLLDAIKYQVKTGKKPPLPGQNDSATPPQK